MEDSEKRQRKIISSSCSVASFGITLPLESVPSPTLRRTRRNVLTSSSLHPINSRGKSPSYRHLDNCIDWYEDYSTSLQRDEARKVRVSNTLQYYPLQYNVRPSVKRKHSRRKVSLQEDENLRLGKDVEGNIEKDKSHRKVSLQEDENFRLGKDVEGNIEKDKSHRKVSLQEDKNFRLGKYVEGNIEKDKNTRRSWSLKQYEVKKNDRCAEKTTYCRPATLPFKDLFKNEYIYKTMENKKKLQGLVRKLAMARNREKQETAWNNYIQELRIKHRAINDGSQPTTSRALEVQDDMEKFKDLYKTRFKAIQSNNCKHLLDDVYNSCTIGTETLPNRSTTNVDTDTDNTPHRPVCNQLNPYLGLTNYGKKSLPSSSYVCYPNTSQGRLFQINVPATSDLVSPKFRKNRGPSYQTCIRCGVQSTSQWCPQCGRRISRLGFVDSQNSYGNRSQNSYGNRSQNSYGNRSQNSNFNRGQNNRSGRNYGTGQNISASKNSRAAGPNYDSRCNNLVGQEQYIQAGPNYAPCQNNCAGTIYEGGVPTETQTDRVLKSKQTNQITNTSSDVNVDCCSLKEEAQSLDSLEVEYEKISKKLVELKGELRKQKIPLGESTPESIDNKTKQLISPDGRNSCEKRRQTQTKSGESLKIDDSKDFDDCVFIRFKEYGKQQKMTSNQCVLESIEKKLDVLINRMNYLVTKRKPGDNEAQKDEYKSTGVLSQKKTNYKCNIDDCVSDRCMARKKLAEEENEKDEEQHRKIKRSDSYTPVNRITLLHLSDVQDQDLLYKNAQRKKDIPSHHIQKDENTIYANKTEQKSFWINNWDNDNENNDHFGFKHEDRYVCRRVTDSEILPFSERYLKGDKIDDILIEEQGKSDQAKRDIEDILNGESTRPFGVQIEVDIPTRERCTEVTDSLSQTKLPELLVPIESNQLAERMTIAINTDPLSLLTLLKISTDTIRRMLSYVHFDYYSLLPLSRPIQSNETYPFNCNICEATFNAQAQLNQHTRLHELDNTREQRDCCVCRHMLEARRNRHPSLFKCRYCGKTFTRAYCCELHEQNCARTRGQRPDIPEALAILR